jgi:hypothetical protein
LWWNEARVGREDATKDRPCRGFLTCADKSGNTIAYVVPITHAPPLNDASRVEELLPHRWMPLQTFSMIR